MSTDKYLNKHKHSSLTAPVAITQNVFLARSLSAGNSNMWSRHHCMENAATYTLEPQALCSIEFLAYIT